MRGEGSIKGDVVCECAIPCGIGCVGTLYMICIMYIYMCKMLWSCGVVLDTRQP